MEPEIAHFVQWLDYRLDDWGIKFQYECFSYLQHRDYLWVLHRMLCNGYLEVCLLREKSLAPTRNSTFRWLSSPSRSYYTVRNPVMLSITHHLHNPQNWLYVLFLMNLCITEFQYRKIMTFIPAYSNTLSMYSQDVHIISTFHVYEIVQQCFRLWTQRVKWLVLK